MRGVSREARAAFEQGAEQAGKTLGQYLSEDVRALVEQQREASPPADPTLQTEIQYLRRLVENLTVMLGAGELPRPSPPPDHNNPGS